jgi:hypothetical protein
LASDTEVSTLLNSFSFGIIFDNDENTGQTVNLHTTEFSIGPANNFIELMGDTYAAAGLNYDYGDPYETTRALFGDDADKDVKIGLVGVEDEFTRYNYVLDPGNVIMWKDEFNYSDNAPVYGVAIVRDVSPVPLPAAAWLFGSAVIGLMGVARRQKA